MEHKLHVYTGPGKGKTTAAVGLSVRAAGHGMRVLFAQLMKDGTSGELAVLRAIPGVTVADMPAMHGFTFLMTPAELEAAAREQQAGLKALADTIREEKPDLIVADELCTALGCRLIGRAAAEELLDAALASGETAVTGRDAPGWLIARADYVSRVDEVKHPCKEGLPAREGIEY